MFIYMICFYEEKLCLYSTSKAFFILICTIVIIRSKKFRYSINIDLFDRLKKYFY